MNACDREFHSLIDAHFDGGLPRAHEAQLRSHLPSCPTCRDRYQEYLAAETLDPKARGARARLARSLGLPDGGSAVGARPVWAWRLGALALAGATCLLLLVARTSPSLDGFSSRGSKVEGPGMKLEVAAFRVRGSQSERVVDHLSAQDELAFAYRNEVGKVFLMIFAVDSAGRVAWYHPAWTDSANNPKAIPISTQVGFKELPEAVRQPLSTGQLALHALFLDSPLDVRSVEDRLARAEPLGDLPSLRAGEIDLKQMLLVTP